MRLAYIPADGPADASEKDSTVTERVKARRGGSLLALDRALLHAPPVADGWNSFLGAIRTRTTLPASVRETAICRVAALNGAWFEWEAHAPILRAALGGSAGRGEADGDGDGDGDGDIDSAIAKLKDTARDDSGTWLSGWDEKHRAAVAYTDAMTRDVTVRESVFKRLREAFDGDERAVVELTATVAAYNCVSRFLVALDVGEMAEKYGVDMS